MSVDLDLTRLREAYSGGMLPSDIVVEVYSRLAAAADPGIFISVVPMDAALSAARALPPFDPTPIRSGACRSRSRTISTSPACRRRPHVPITPIPRPRARPASPGCRRPARSSSARPISTSSPPGSSACARPIRRPRTPSTRPSCPADRSGSAVAVARGIVASRSAPTRPARAACRPALNNIVGLKPTLGAVSTRGVVPACRTLDCVSVFAATVDDA